MRDPEGVPRGVIGSPVMLAVGVVDGVTALVTVPVSDAVGNEDVVGVLEGVAELERVAVSDAGVYVAVGVLCGEVPPV